MTARRLSSLLVFLAAWLALPAVASAAPGANGRIVFSSERETWQSELYSVAPDGTGVTRLTWSATIEQHPAWSPDGTQIAFADPAGISLVDVESRETKLVHEGEGYRGVAWGREP